MASETEFLEAYEHIKAAYKHAMSEVDKAIGHEEEQRPLEAITTYENCVRIVDDIFAIPVELPDSVDTVATQWMDACQLIQRLKVVKTDINNRLQVLHTRHADELGAGFVALPKTHSYRDIIAGLREVIAKKNTGVQLDTLFHAHAKLYKISSDGSVAAMAGETSMSLVMCSVGGEWQHLNGLTFIQCEIDAQPTTPSNEPTTSQAIAPIVWIYALVPVLATCYRTEYGAFIFPDLEADAPGAAFGIMLCTPSPAKTSVSDLSPDEEQLEDLQQFFLDLLEAVLAGHVELVAQPADGAGRFPRDTSELVSKRIVTAADFIARHLVQGAEKTGELIVRSTPHIIARLQPAPPDAPPVSTKLQTSVEVAKNVTGAAVGVTGWVAGKVGSASMAIGRYLAPHIQTHGAALLQRGFGYDSTEANSKMEGALTIAAGAVEGFSTIFNGLETSAKILGNNLSDNSVKIIEHKYGPSAGNIATGTFDTIGNAFTVSQNVNYITPKGLAKRMAKNTGKAVVADYQRTIRTQQVPHVTAGTLYPDLRQLKEHKE